MWGLARGIREWRVRLGEAGWGVECGEWGVRLSQADESGEVQDPLWPLLTAWMWLRVRKNPTVCTWLHKQLHSNVSCSDPSSSQGLAGWIPNLLMLVRTQIKTYINWERLGPHQTVLPQNGLLITVPAFCRMAIWQINPRAVVLDTVKIFQETVVLNLRIPGHVPKRFFIINKIWMTRKSELPRIFRISVSASLKDKVCRKLCQ